MDERQKDNALPVMSESPCVPQHKSLSDISFPSPIRIRNKNKEECNSLLLSVRHRNKKEKEKKGKKSEMLGKGTHESLPGFSGRPEILLSSTTKPHPGVILVTLPFRMSNGEQYGICGFEMAVQRWNILVLKCCFPQVHYARCHFMSSVALS